MKRIALLTVISLVLGAQFAGTAYAAKDKCKTYSGGGFSDGRR